MQAILDAIRQDAREMAADRDAAKADGNAVKAQLLSGALLGMETAVFSILRGLVHDHKRAGLYCEFDALRVEIGKLVK